jgi:hypothetical protein
MAVKRAKPIPISGPIIGIPVDEVIDWIDSRATRGYHHSRAWDYRVDGATARHAKSVR